MDVMPEAAPAVTEAARRWVVVAMLISTFMAATEVTIISTAMPTIVGRLGGFDLFTWAFGVYVLGQAVTTPIFGKLADLYGRRRVYLGCTAVFLTGSLLCGFAWSMPSLIAFRAIQGLGGGGLIPLATIIIGDVSTPAQRPRLLSYVTGIWGIAAITGPLLGSLCVGTLGWPLVFWINLPFGVVTTTLVARHLQDPVRKTAGRVNLLSTALLAAGIAAWMAALIQSQSLPWAGLIVLGATGAACLWVFARRERGSGAPMLATQLMRRPMILAANCSTCLSGALVIAVTGFMPAWVQGVEGRSALTAGFVLGLMTVSWTGASLCLGRVLGRSNRRLVALCSACGLIVGAAFLVSLSGGGLVRVLLSSVAMGAGLGISSLVFTVAVQDGVGYADRGSATSLFYFFRLMGQAVGAAAFGGVLNFGLHRAGPAAFGALQSLMDPVSRSALAPANTMSLVSVLAGSLHGVFVLALIVALATVPVALLVPRRTA